MPANLRVDIHIHTLASDGVWTPEQLLDEVLREGIELFAVTDHDTTAHVTETARRARLHDLLFLRGVEINTSLGGYYPHILGYDVDPDNAELAELLAHNRRLMEAAEYDMLRRLEEYGYSIDWPAFEHYQYDRSRGGFRALNFCIDQGFCSDVGDFFGRLFGAPRRVPYPRYPHPRKAVEAITGAGGVPVLAHPFGSIGSAEKAEREELFAELRGTGIRGMECFSPYHSPEDTAAAAEHCRRHGLLITGGSDTHGPFTAKRKLGRPEVTTAELELGELLERAGASASAAG